MSKEKKTQYLGPKKIRMVMPNKEDDRDLNVEFKDGVKITIRQKLFNIMVSDTKTKSSDDNLTDAVNYFIAKKFVCDLADYGMEKYQITSIADAVGTLIHNLVEAKIGEKFGCDSSDRIKIEDIL